MLNQKAERGITMQVTQPGQQMNLTSLHLVWAHLEVVIRKHLLSLLTVISLCGVTLQAFGQEGGCDVNAEAADLDFTLEDMHGDPVRLRDYLGQVIILDFWATWCAPCRIEIPGFIEMLDEFGDDGLVVLGVSVNDPVEELLIYAEELGMDYPVLVGEGEDELFDTYGPLVGFPTTFVIDRRGRICHEHIGFTEKSTFIDNITGLL